MSIYITYVCNLIDTSIPTLMPFAASSSQKFFCGGRLIFGPDVASLFLSTILIAGPSVAFCCQVITKLHSHESSHSNVSNSDHKHILGLPVLIVTIVIMISVSDK